MSKPNDPGQPNPPEHHDDELTNLNADDLDVQELDDKLLEDVAGGTDSSKELDACSGFSCSDYWC